MKLGELVKVLLANDLYQVDIECKPCCSDDFKRGYGTRCVLWNTFLDAPYAIKYYDYDVKYIDAKNNLILLKEKKNTK